MSTATVPKAKACDRCGEQIIWNPKGGFFQSIEFPNHKHCCKKVCNKEGCGGHIYFSNNCPKNTETGNAIPLEIPIPVVDPTNPAQMIWIPHKHRTAIPATDVPVQPLATVVPETKPLAAGQDTLVANIKVDTPPATGIQASEKKIVAEVANQDVNAAILSAINEQNQRLGKLEQYFNDVVPAITKYIDMMEHVIPLLNAICGKIADGSIKSASDLVQHNLNERQEQNLQ